MFLSRMFCHLKRISLCGNTVIRSSTARKYSITYDIKCGRVDVDGVSLYWERYGHGPHVVLCIPGLAGSVSESFHPVWKCMNTTKYTLIGLDPPGHGRSYPPEVDFLSEELYSKKEARIANTMMSKLGYPEYSALGWSNGGQTALFLGGDYPDRIRKVIACNSPCRSTKNSFKFVKAMTNLDKWPPATLKRLTNFYGQAYFRKMLQNQLDFVQQDNETHRDRLFKLLLASVKNISSPTLIISGHKDISWNPEAIECIGAEIRDFRLISFPNYGHSHLEFLDEFMKTCEEFLDE